MKLNIYILNPKKISVHKELIINCVKYSFIALIFSQSLLILIRYKEYPIIKYSILHTIGNKTGGKSIPLDKLLYKENEDTNGTKKHPIKKVINILLINFFTLLFM